MTSLQNSLDTLNGVTKQPWVILESGENKVLRKDFVFDSFPTAFSFMSQVAEVSERVQHHPRWSNIYNRVSIALSTLDSAEGGRGEITNKDFALAWEIEAVYRRITASGEKAAS